MTSHEYTTDLASDWFRRLMELIDGLPDGTVSGQAKREVVGADYLGALQILTAQNHACHAGIITEDDNGVVHFDREKLESLVSSWDGKSHFIRGACVFACGGV